VLRTLLAITLLTAVASAQPSEPAHPFEPVPAETSPPAEQPAEQPPPTPESPAPGAGATSSLNSSAAPSGPPGAAQLQPIYATASRPSVMTRRWALGGGIGWQSISVLTDTGPNVTLGTLEIAGRFRIARSFEVGAILLLGGADGLKSGGLYLEGRYRFLAERRWNIYIGYAIGVISVAPTDATKDEKRGRGGYRITLFGLERRWEKFALFGDVDLVGIAKNEDLMMPAMPTLAWQFARYRLSGGAVTFGGTFYF
jgi:hypothetical protein